MYGFPQQNPRLYDPSLIGWWPLDEGMGSSFRNISGYPVSDVYGRGGSISVSPSWGKDKLGVYSSLNGTNLISIDDVNSSYRILTGTGSIWIKTSNAGLGWCGIFLKHYTWGIYVNDNVIHFYDWGNVVVRNSGIRIDDNNWHHVLMTFQVGVTDGIVLYLDGVYRYSTTVQRSLGEEPTDLGFYIGCGGYWAGMYHQFFTGNFMDFRLWNRILSASEIQSLYQEKYQALPIPTSELFYGFPKKKFLNN